MSAQEVVDCQQRRFRSVQEVFGIVGVSADSEVAAVLVGVGVYGGWYI